MSSLREILSREQQPRDTEEKQRTIRLIKMGAFLRAYDWSAWLMKRSGSSLNAGLESTDGKNHVFVGFPLSSIEKFQPEGADVRMDADGTPREWVFPLTVFPPEEEYDRLEEEYNIWRNETIEKLQAEQENRKLRKKEEQRRPGRTEGREMGVDDEENAIPSAHPLRLTDIARQILQFPLSQRSPEDCARFIRTLQMEITDLL